MYTIEENMLLITEKLNKELKRQGIVGAITLYSCEILSFLQNEISLFYENNKSRYFFFFLLPKDITQEPYKGLYPSVFDPKFIIKQVKEKISKIDTSYIV